MSNGLPKTRHVKLWNAPYNGGWIWFDKQQIRRFSCGWNKPTLWWCFAGFCGQFILQTPPWKGGARP